MAAEETLDRWMGVEQEWAVPVRREYLRWPEEYRARVPRGSLTYASELVFSLYNYRFNDGSPAFPWFGRSMEQRNTYTRGLLRNGGFFEHQWNHVETSTPECRNHWDLVRYDRASDVWVYIACAEFRRRCGVDICCWKSNVDAVGVSRATHENYDCDRARFEPSQRALTPYLVFRQLFAGSGGFWRGRFVISPRAMVLDAIESGQAGARCILHTYDEPLTLEGDRYIASYPPDKSHRFRCHQVCGDALMSEVSNLLRFGITSYVISAVEEGLLRYLELDDPLYAIKSISRSPGGPWRARAGARVIDAVDYLASDVLEAIERLFAEKAVQPHDQLTLEKFKLIVDKLRQGLVEDLRNDVQWVTTQYFLDNYLDEYEAPGEGYDESSKRIAASLDLTDVAHGGAWLDVLDGLERADGRAKALRAERLFGQEEVREAVLFPPPNSRGELRVVLANMLSLSELDWHVAAKAGSYRYRCLGSLDGWNKESIREKLKEFG